MSNFKNYVVLFLTMVSAELVEAKDLNALINNIYDYASSNFALDTIKKDALEKKIIALSKEVSPKEKGEAGNTWEHIAFLKLPQSLIAQMIDGNRSAIKALEEKNNLGQTPLYLALENPDSINIVRFAFQFGVDPNTTTSKNATYLHRAVDVGNLDLIKILLDKGVSPFIKNTYGNTAYQSAIRNNRIDAANFIKSYILKQLGVE
jgi:hypothetical protein